MQGEHKYKTICKRLLKRNGERWNTFFSKERRLMRNIHICPWLWINAPHLPPLRLQWCFMVVLLELFPGRAISKGRTVPWSARSPDLSVYDYFLVVSRPKVSSHRPRIIQGLNEIITKEIGAISQIVLGHVCENFLQRLWECSGQSSSQVTHVLSKIWVLEVFMFVIML